MAVKIRLRAQGNINRRVYRVVVTDSRAPRDGKYIEAVGWYNPRAKAELQAEIKPDRIQHWMMQGAQLSEKVEYLLKQKAPGVLASMKKK